VIRDDRADHKGAIYDLSVNNVLDIHGERFIEVAFSQLYADLGWSTARMKSRDLVTQVLGDDSDSVVQAVTTVCAICAQSTKGPPKYKTPSLSIKRRMWASFYSTIQTNDIDGIATLIGFAAKTAYLDLMETKPYATHIKAVPEIEGALKDINRSLGIMRNGLVATLTKFENHNLSSSALDLLQRPEVVKNIVILMLSPVEDLQVSAQILVRLAFDVDARQECFRALLENVPDPAIQGIFEFLSKHARYANEWPEARSLSKSLVGCCTDIIEVLCTTPDGLLHSPHFLQSSEDNGPAAMLPRLWSLMAKSITVIFKRTPRWSEFFDSSVMVDWMRDALIYGRDMLAQWRVIENAANTRLSHEKLKPGELSSLGKKMMETLQDVTLELTQWLRLTDEELLHQAFSLLTSLLDCFRKANITPKAENLRKLRRHINSARSGNASERRTRLDAGRLLLLEVALDNVESNEDALPKKTSPPPQLPQPPRTVAKPAEPVKKNYIQGGTSRVASGTSASAQNKLTSFKPKVAAIARPSSMPISKYFTERDKQLLDADITIPSFRKSTKAPSVPAPTAVAGPSQLPTTVPKDGGPGKSVVSVSDSSSESDDEEENDEEKPLGGLAGLNKIQRSPKISKAPERRQTKLLEIPTHTSRADRERVERIKRRDEARIAAARLKPDISGLHKTLLSWDYNHTGSTPPGEKLQFRQVPERFDNFTDYENIFKPLLLLECWAQIVQAKEQAADILECRITSRQFNDSWLDIDISVEGNLYKGWYLNETDVVLLRNTANDKRIMAKTQSYRSSPYQGTQATLRCIVKDGDPGLQINAKWRLSKLFRYVLVDL
jgi:senataxin